MKKIQSKWFVVPNDPDELMTALNKEGSLGWAFVHGIGTPAGLRFLLQRTTDEDVDVSDIVAYEKEKKEAELLAKFAPGPAKVNLR